MARDSLVAGYDPAIMDGDLLFFLLIPHKIAGKERRFNAGYDPAIIDGDSSWLRGGDIVQRHAQSRRGG